MERYSFFDKSVEAPQLVSKERSARRETQMGGSSRFERDEDGRDACPRGMLRRAVNRAAASSRDVDYRSPRAVTPKREHADVGMSLLYEIGRLKRRGDRQMG